MNLQIINQQKLTHYGQHMRKTYNHKRRAVAAQTGDAAVKYYPYITFITLGSTKCSRREDKIIIR